MTNEQRLQHLENIIKALADHLNIGFKEVEVNNPDYEPQPIPKIKKLVAYDKPNNKNL